jgi:hypothetical protein
MIYACINIRINKTSSLFVFFGARVYMNQNSLQNKNKNENLLHIIMSDDMIFFIYRSIRFLDLHLYIHTHVLLLIKLYTYFSAVVNNTLELICRLVLKFNGRQVKIKQLLKFSTYLEIFFCIK